MMKKFQRTIEDFSCEKCGEFVHGSGYTNHCPYCLWSKHVDVYPGDRLASCGGMMKPARIETESSWNIIVHQCNRCGSTKRNKAAKEDRPDSILAVVRAQDN